MLTVFIVTASVISLMQLVYLIYCYGSTPWEVNGPKKQGIGFIELSTCSDAFRSWVFWEEGGESCSSGLVVSANIIYAAPYLIIILR